MIARLWRGAVRAEDAAAYAAYVQRTGIEGYKGTPGNRGAWQLWRTEGRPGRSPHGELLGVAGRPSKASPGRISMWPSSIPTTISSSSSVTYRSHYEVADTP